MMQSSPSIHARVVSAAKARPFTSPAFLAILVPLLLGLAACSRDPKVQAQRYLDNANKFFAKGKYKEASILYRRALQKDLRFGEAYYRLGLTDLKLASYGDAARMLQRAVDLQPSNADAATKLGDLYLLAAAQDSQHSADYQKEVTDLAQHLIDKASDPYDGHRLNGQIALMKKDPATAVREFSQAQQVKPLQTDLILAYFEALAENDQFAEAEKLGQTFIASNKSYGPLYDVMYLNYVRRNQVPGALEIMKQKVANNPAVPNYILQLASHYYINKQRPEMDSVMQRLQDEKTFPAGHLMAGDFYFFRLREFDLARQEYDAGLKAFPKDKGVYQKRLVELYANTGRPDDANQLVNTILKQDPKDSDAIAMRAALMLSTGDRQQISQAATDLQSLVTKNAENHLLRFNLARALIAKGDTEQARIQLEQAVKLRSDFLVARELLGRVYLLKGDTGKALQQAQEIVKLDPNNLQAHLIKSSALLSIHDADQARTELDFITKAYPHNIDARLQVGYLAFQDKDYKRAEQIFDEVHKADSRDFRALVGVVETMASQGRMPDAIKQVQSAVAAEPNRHDLQLALANLLFRAERYDEAIAGFQDLLQKEPASADLMFRLGETERRKGDLNAAIDLFRRCSQAAPNNTLCALQLGLLLDGVGRRDQAKPVYEQILRMDPDQPVALNNLAFIKAEEGGDLDQALTMAQRARQKLPQSPDVADTLGWIYIKKNLSEDAVKLFAELVHRDPKDYHFHYHYGMALLQKGDRVTAKKELQMALDNHPSRDDEGKIRDLLLKN